VLSHDEIHATIQQTEDTIETALWNAVRDEDHQKELAAYKDARKVLESLTDLSLDLEKKRNRVFSYCLMRMDDTLVTLGDTKDSVGRMREALQFAQRSESSVQIARCFLALGGRLASDGLVEEAEAYWERALVLAEGNSEKDMQQIVGWTLIVRGHFLSLKGEINAALETIRRAEAVSEAIDNYAGVARANEALAKLYSSLNDEHNEQLCRKKGEDYLERAKTEEK
jgi:tetratricopeptide (TPR) repeat protein